MDTLTGNVQRIPHGLTNKSWIIKNSNQAFVIRVPFEHSDQLKIDRENEAIILKLVADHHIGAPILFCDPKESLLITAYMNGSVWQLEDARKPLNIQKISLLLKKLHMLPAPSGIKTTYYAEVLKYYWDLLKIPYNLNLLQLSEQLDQTRQTALCHHDLNHFNVIEDGKKLWLIDWEYAGLGDPYFDLASLASYHSYTPAQTSLLLKSYFNKITPAIQKRFNDTDQIFKIIEVLWLAARNR